MDQEGVDLELKAAFGRLARAEFSVATGDEVAGLAADAARLRAFVDHATMRVRRRAAELAALAANGSALDQMECTHDETAAQAVAAADVLTGAGGLTGRDARDVRARDHVCSDFPVFDDALASGAVTAAHVDVLARVVKPLSDAERSDVTARIGEVLDLAVSMPVAVFERSVRQIVDAIRADYRAGSDAEELDRQRRESTVKRWTDRDTGMKHTLLSLDPLRDAMVWTAIDAELARVRQASSSGEPFMALQVQAVVNAISAGTGSPSSGELSGGRVTDIMVHVDAASLCHGRHAETLCETVDGVALPVSTVQRLCCEAVLSAVIIKPDGTVEQLYAEVRTASRSHRRRLAAMYATCAHPNCEVGFAHCRIHHVVWFSKGGKTVIENLVPLCEQHHHLVHEGRWNLTLARDRQLTWYRPDGTVWATTGPNRGPTRAEHHRTEHRQRDRSPTKCGLAPPGESQPSVVEQAALFDPSAA